MLRLKHTVGSLVAALAVTGCIEENEKTAHPRRDARQSINTLLNADSVGIAEKRDFWYNKVNKSIPTSDMSRFTHDLPNEREHRLLAFQGGPSEQPQAERPQEAEKRESSEKPQKPLEIVKSTKESIRAEIEDAEKKANQSFDALNNNPEVKTEDVIDFFENLNALQQKFAAVDDPDYLAIDFKNLGNWQEAEKALRSLPNRDQGFREFFAELNYARAKVNALIDKYIKQLNPELRLRVTNEQMRAIYSGFSLQNFRNDSYTDAIGILRSAHEYKKEVDEMELEMRVRRQTEENEVELPKLQDNLNRAVTFIKLLQRSFPKLEQTRYSGDVRLGLGVPIEYDNVYDTARDVREQLDRATSMTWQHRKWLDGEMVYSPDYKSYHYVDKK